MHLYSTNHVSPDVNFEEAIFRGLPQDNGLYMPSEIPVLPKEFFETIDKKTFSEIGFAVAHTLIGNEIPADKLKAIVEDVLSFDAPLVEIEKNRYSLELTHGPSLAFKDFGARFMSRVMSYFLQIKNKEINILVATSGDTGGAVALGFLGTPGIKVTILYPSGKVSEFQELQLTALGQNITALEVNGTFDDCQRMVKEAFLDPEFNSKLNLSSANSINIARLIPQSFYYFYSYAKLKAKGLPIVYSVPSGNFGNLTAGLFAKRMGLPVDHFVVSTNANNIVPKYLETGLFEPKPSVRTISNAMDVGNPSNFARMKDLYQGNVDAMRNDVSGYAFSDPETVDAMRKVYTSSNYLMCPHTAVAYLGLKKYEKSVGHLISGVALSTAHPSKFMNEMEPDLANKVVIPESLKALMNKEKKSIKIGPNLQELKSTLLK
ncbi:MAG: threonine synthase [Cytophagales bacterium]|nr:threonine synthase [Cytophagales bacterium]